MQRKSRFEEWLVAGYRPVFNLVGALHDVNVHSDLDFDMRGNFGGPGVHVNKHQASPELALLQKVQRSMSELILIRDTGELVQD